MATERTYHDPLHGAITLSHGDPVEALLIRLIDTPALQRLRRIRQLGPANLTFHGAETSRFTHSLGVMAIARRAFDRLAVDYPQLQPYRVVVLCAALLHDVGHGPFSHTAEEIFGGHHERWTRKILRESAPVRQLLDGFDSALAGQIEQVFLKQFPVPLVSQLVSSQLDCDRLDYLMRDSYFTGASYGKLDLDRIILALRYDPVSQQLVVAKKGLAAIEHYLIVRYFMYAQIYNHAKNLAATVVLERAFARARELLKQGQLVADAVMAAWLLGMQNLALADYLAADDDMFMYHLGRWQQGDDPILADLCRRYRDRDMLKTLDLTARSGDEQQQILQEVQQRSRQAGLEPDYYVGLRLALSRGYTLYQRGIDLQMPHGLQDISELSPLVKTLSQPMQKAWLIYPRELAGIADLG
ncbi:MAG: hypothetical protein RLZZ511_1795 [Cyanobacteriota bacterium]